jgi:anthranilate phosphoribosyltransferase
MLIQQAIQQLVEGKDLSDAEIAGSVSEIAEGQATPAQMGAFLTALRRKGETVEEIAAFAAKLRTYSLQIRPSNAGKMIDTCGTGGDAVKTFNVSTISAIVAAGAGAVVAKHGGRSVTSRCGSADLLEHLGFNLGMEPTKVKDSIEQVGIGFMFAPGFHPAMKNVGPVRKELGIRTIFNLMGPLLNPAGADSQVLGVYSPKLTAEIAQVLARLGSRHAMVIHALEGMDEISVSGKTMISTLRDGEVRTQEFGPRDYGVELANPGTLEVVGVEECVRTALDILSGSTRGGSKLDMVLVNSAAALMVAGKADSFAGAIPIARESIESGNAFKKLEGLVRFSGGNMTMVEQNARKR